MCSRFTGGILTIFSLAFLGLGFSDHLAAQCYGCDYSPTLNKHAMNHDPPPIGWQGQPNGYHSTYSWGSCLFYHYIGCDLDLEELDGLEDMEAEELIVMLEKYPVSLRVLPEYEVLQVVDCSGHVTEWIPLEKSQLRILTKE